MRTFPVKSVCKYLQLRIISMYLTSFYDMRLRHTPIFLSLLLAWLLLFNHLSLTIEVYRRSTSAKEEIITGPRWGGSSAYLNPAVNQLLRESRVRDWKWSGITPLICAVVVQLAMIIQLSFYTTFCRMLPCYHTFGTRSSLHRHQRSII